MGHEVLELLNDDTSVKILVTSDEEGLPHPAVKDSLRLEGEDIVYTEFIESSKTNRYLTKSLWFDKKASVLLLTKDKRSFKIVVQPIRAIVNGKTFQRYYEETLEKFGELDLSTVWILKPLDITEQTLKTRVSEESERRPYFLHLDKIAKQRSVR